METKIGTIESSSYKPSNDVGCLPSNGTVSTVQNSLTPSMLNASEATLGRHLARRLVQIGVTDVFSVPGDFNLTLLDHLIAEPGLKNIGCCNELNAGYAADGYARSRGVGACVVTFTVGGLSVLNAIAGAYSENLPVICIVGGPNSNDYGTSRILHHTIGLPDFSQELRCFQTVTCYQAVVNNLEDAHELIDTAISTALKESKPVYISVGCNLPAIPHPTFSREPVPFCLAPKLSNHMGLEAAVEAAAEFLNKAVKPVMVGGPKIRVAKAADAFVELADSCGYAAAVMPSAKGLIPETHPRFIGTYWGAVSTAFCAEIVESADAYIFAGPIFNDYSSVGYSLLLKKEKAIIVQPDRVVIGNGSAFGCILMKDFLSALAKRLQRNTTAYENYHSICVPEGVPLQGESKEALRVNVLFKHIQAMLSGDTAVIAETGDSRFNCQKLKLPAGCDAGYEVQMQFDSTEDSPLSMAVIKMFIRVTAVTLSSVGKFRHVEAVHKQNKVVTRYVTIQMLNACWVVSTIYESFSELNSSPGEACLLMGFDCNCKNHKVAFSTWFFHMEELSPITVIIPALTDYAFGISHWILNAFAYYIICVTFGDMVPTWLASHLHINSILSSKEEDRGGTIQAHHASVLTKSECLHTLKNVSKECPFVFPIRNIACRKELALDNTFFITRGWQRLQRGAGVLDCYGSNNRHMSENEMSSEVRYGWALDMGIKHSQYSTLRYNLCSKLVFVSWRCTKPWYYQALVLVTGLLENPEFPLNSLALCTTLNGWVFMISVGFNAAASVRVSNELGASQPKSAAFSVKVVTVLSFITSVVIAILQLGYSFIWSCTLFRVIQVYMFLVLLLDKVFGFFPGLAQQLRDELLP